VPAQGGRFAEFVPRDAFRFELFGRLEFALPNPCGPLPESVELPCALQERPEFPAVEREELIEPSPRAPPGCVAYDGRLDRSSDSRLALKPLDVPIECATVDVPPRFPEKLDVFIVCTAECDAAAAGVLRAVTLLLSTREDGVATWLPKFAAPKELARVGEACTPPVDTCALRKVDSLKCCAPRFTACPFTNVLREAVVTACALCAYA
jgi:hypothetical protein